MKIRIFSGYNYYFLIFAITLPLITCQQTRPPWINKNQQQIPAIDSILFVELIKQKLATINDSTSNEVNGIKLYATEAIKELYAKNDFLPIWNSRERYQMYLGILDSIHYDGLISDDYDLYHIRDSFNALDTANYLDHGRLVDLDVITTNSFLLLVLHLLEGKSEPKLLDPNWNYNFSHIDKHSIDSVYRTISGGSISKYFQQIKRRSDYYLEMNQTLKKLYQVKAQGGWRAIEYQGEVKVEPGDRSSLLPKIRERLAGTSSIPSTSNDSHFYDTVLATEVVRFKIRHGLPTNAIIDTATIDAMNITVTEKIDKIRVNLERARWLINDISQKRIVVNIANFSAYLIDSNEIVYSSKVVVGTPFTKTPVFESYLQYIEFNPSWTIPRSIIENEILPAIKKDPDYLYKQHMLLIDAQGNVVSQDSLQITDDFPYTIRQTPGSYNALGRVKFIIPNFFSVYLHDTPSRHLFEHSERAFSHGCIRIENPLYWAQLLLNDPQWTEATIEQVIAEGESVKAFPKDHIRVMIIYFTHITDLDGSEYYYPDIYNRDSAVLEVLNAPIDVQVLEYKRKKIASKNMPQ